MVKPNSPWWLSWFPTHTVYRTIMSIQEYETNSHSLWARRSQSVDNEHTRGISNKRSTGCFFNIGYKNGFRFLRMTVCHYENACCHKERTGLLLLRLIFTRIVTHHLFFDFLSCHQQNIASSTEIHFRPPYTLEKNFNCPQSSKSLMFTTYTFHSLLIWSIHPPHRRLHSS